MRRSSISVLALGVLACAESVEPEQLEVPAAAAEPARTAEYSHEAERARVVDPATQPRLELVARPPADADEGWGEELCPYVVEARNFPALSDDGGRIVEAYTYVPGNADMIAERMELTWLAGEGVRIDTVFDRQDDWRDEAPDCAIAAARVRERVAAANAELGRTTWRAIEALDAYYSEPGFVHAYERWDAGVDDAELFASLGGAERPVEVFYHNGQFIARIRGLEVLQKTPRPDWRSVDDEFCMKDAQIFSVMFDRETGAALVRFNYSSGGCLCDDRAYFGRVELEPGVVAAADLRGTAAFSVILDRALEGDGP